MKVRLVVLYLIVVIGLVVTLGAAAAPSNFKATLTQGYCDFPAGDVDLCGTER